MSARTNKKTPSLAKASAILGKALVPAKPAKRAAKAKPAKAPADQPATITTVVSVRGGNGIYVEASNGQSVIIADWQQGKETLKLARKGADFATLRDYLAGLVKPAKLANGVDSRNSPHSAKAVADNKAKQPTPTGKGKAKAPAAPKAKKTSTRGYDATMALTTLVKPKDSGLAEGSGRMAKLVFAAKCKSVGAFLGQVVTDAQGKEHKCDAGALSGMLKRNHVRVG